MAALKMNAPHLTYIICLYLLSVCMCVDEIISNRDSGAIPGQIVSVWKKEATCRTWGPAAPLPSSPTHPSVFSNAAEPSAASAPHFQRCPVVTVHAREKGNERNCAFLLWGSYRQNWNELWSYIATLKSLMQLIKEAQVGRGERKAPLLFAMLL